MLILLALVAHEVAHILCAVILKIEFNKFKITLFGFNFDAYLDYEKFYKKLSLFLSGPCCNIILYLIFKNTKYNNFAEINAFVASINLVPIVPLDGGNICKSILEIYLNIESVCRYMIMTNTFFIVCFLVIIHMYENYLYFILILIALKGIVEENQNLIEKNIKKNFLKKFSKYKKIN